MIIFLLGVLFTTFTVIQMYEWKYFFIVGTVIFALQFYVVQVNTRLLHSSKKKFFKFRNVVKVYLFISFFVYIAWFFFVLVSYDQAFPDFMLIVQPYALLICIHIIVCILLLSPIMYRSHVNLELAKWFTLAQWLIVSFVNISMAQYHQWKSTGHIYYPNRHHFNLTSLLNPFAYSPNTPDYVSMESNTNTQI